jgi:ABC-type antimicrobial peptide transport system permease subunit
VTRSTQGTAQAARSWLLGVTRDRLRSQWRLLALVIIVAVLGSTLVTSLGMLVSATEQAGARASLDAIPRDRTAVHVRVTSLSGSTEEAKATISTALKKSFGPSVPFASRGVALSALMPLAGTGDTGASAAFPSDTSGFAYFGQLDDIEHHATLTAGSWPAQVSPAGSAIDVAIPSAAADYLGLAVGDELSVNGNDGTITTTIVAVYTAEPGSDDYWELDPLHAAGNDTGYPMPGLRYYLPVEALGPLVVAPGGLATAAIAVESAQFRFDPDFSALELDDLGPLLQRFSGVDQDVRIAVGQSASELAFTSETASSIEAVSSGLVITRSTVLVVSLLLLVLAVAAIAQAARLLNDARVGERRLMRSRGAAPRHMIGLAVVEAIVIGLIAALTAPVLATLVYRVVAAQPAMVAAEMPAGIAVNPLALATAGGAAVVFVGVLLIPLLRVGRAAGESDRVVTRQKRSTGMMRSGLDVALVALAALAYWQLQSYRGVIDSSAGVSIDPILAVGPALVLVAGAMVCLRLIPLLSMVIERLGSRSRHVIVPLASWELGRRSQRAAAAILLLSLSIGVGTFGLSFLDTWRQSQVDQAMLAVGPPVRVSADSEALTKQSVALAKGAEGAPQPVIRRLGLLNLDDGGSPDGIPVQVLGLPAPARSLIDRGRLSEVGGSTIETVLPQSATPVAAIALPPDATSLSTAVRITGEGGRLSASTATVRAVVEDSTQLISTVDFGVIPIDGERHAVEAALPTGAGLTLVGIQAVFDGDFAEGAGEVVSEGVTIDLEAFAASGAQLTMTEARTWVAATVDSRSKPARAARAPAGWALRLSAVVDSGRTSAFSLVGWKPTQSVMAVLPESFATRYQVQPGSILSLATQGSEVKVQIGTGVPVIPGAATAPELEAMRFGLAANAAVKPSIVVDQYELARVFAEAGLAGPVVDEWWVDVPVGSGLAYEKAHAVKNGQASFSSDELGLQLQQAPLRVGTQAALWVSIVAGALLAAIGFAMHVAATLRSRRIELAQLRAVGLTRRGVLGLVAFESMLLCALGIVFGVAIGILLAYLVGPLVTVSRSGVAPVPSVIVHVPVMSIALLAVEMVSVLCLIVLIVARSQRFTQPSDLLRGGADL